MRGRWSLVIVVFVAGASLAAEVPVAVSPGSLTGVQIADACPTFSWDSVPGARNHELVVYLLGEEGEEAELVIKETLPGSASGWTPSLDSCLERGGQYAWSVRASVRDGEATEWSPTNLFDVTAGPTEVEFEEALRVVQDYLGSNDETRASEAEASPPSAQTARPLSPTKTKAPGGATLGVPAATLLNVDGNIDAVSFTGDGSGLSGLATDRSVCTLYSEAGIATSEWPSFCKFVFVTSGTYDGDLVTAAGGLGSPANGLEAGDLICQDLADAAVLGGTFKAWLSDAATNAKDRFTSPTGPWFRLFDGLLVASDLTDLLTCDPFCIAAAILYTESGALGSDFVWTGTDSDGTTKIPGLHCNNWITDNAFTNGLAGISLELDGTDTTWTDVEIQACSTDNRLYCFQDP